MTFYVWHYRKSNICLGWDSASEGFYLKVHLILFSITTDYFFPQFPVVESIWERTKAERLEHLIFKTIFEYTKDRRLQQVRMAPPAQLRAHSTEGQGGEAEAAQWTLTAQISPIYGRWECQPNVQEIWKWESTLAWSSLTPFVLLTTKEPKLKLINYTCSII